jgi:hypothetical protein
MTDNPFLLRLAAYRLEHDLSFEQLADEMKQAGFPVRARSLHLALTNRLQTKPRERTLYKIQQFVGTLGRRSRTPRPRKRRAGAQAHV